MPYKISWIIKYELILHQIEGELTPPNIREFTDELADYLAEALKHGHDSVPAIFDMREVEGNLPVESLTEQQMLELASTIDARLLKAKRGFLVLIASSEQVAAFVSLINLTQTQPMTTVITMEEALAIIRDMYPRMGKSLDSLSASDST